MVGHPPTGAKRVEPEVRKLAMVALVGLLLLFPVFNQVQATTLEALRDADHKSQFKDFIKDWDDVPEDEKLSYWDGRNAPPGDGDFDRGDVDEDGRFHRPDGGDGGDADGPDRDGDGVPDDEDPQPDDPTISNETQGRWVTRALWEFDGGAQSVDERETIAQMTQYRYINITWDYSGFTGSAVFELYADQSTLWRLDANLGNSQTYTISASDSDGESHEDVQFDELAIRKEYNPLSAPDEFHITITGARIEYGNE